MAFSPSPKQKPLFLWVNAMIHGSLRVRALDADGLVVCDYDKMRFDGKTDSTRLRLNTRVDDLAGRRIRFEFSLDDASLYAFWVADARGASGGFLAGGALGFPSIVDR